MVPRSTPTAPSRTTTSRPRSAPSRCSRPAARPRRPLHGDPRATCSGRGGDRARVHGRGHALAPGPAPRRHRLYEVVPGLMDLLPKELRKTVESIQAAPTAELLRLSAETIRRLDWAPATAASASRWPRRSPPSAPTSSSKAARAWPASTGLGVHTHLSESKIQAITAQRRWGKTAVARLEDVGLLGPNFVVPRSWLTDDDIPAPGRRRGRHRPQPREQPEARSGIAARRAARRGRDRRHRLRRLDVLRQPEPLRGDARGRPRRQRRSPTTPRAGSPRSRSGAWRRPARPRARARCRPRRHRAGPQGRSRAAARGLHVPASAQRRHGLAGLRETGAAGGHRACRRPRLVRGGRVLTVDDDGLLSGPRRPPTGSAPRIPRPGRWPPSWRRTCRGRVGPGPPRRIPSTATPRRWDDRARLDHEDLSLSPRRSHPRHRGRQPCHQGERVRDASWAPAAAARARC